MTMIVEYPDVENSDGRGPNGRIWLARRSSAIATSLLQRQRFERLIEVSGGIAAWEAARLPVQRS